MTPAEAAAELRALHPTRALTIQQKNALVVAILMLEDRALADRAEDDTKPIALPPHGSLAARGLR